MYVFFKIGENRDAVTSPLPHMTQQIRFVFKSEIAGRGFDTATAILCVCYGYGEYG